MAVIEQDVVFTTKDANGNTVIQMPITRAENIENVMSIEQGGTGADNAAEARKNLGITDILLDYCYPVGSLYWSKNATNPGTLFGGTWTQVKDKFVLAAGDSYEAGSTGGEASHKLTTNEMPSHSHTGSAESAGIPDHIHAIGYNNANNWGTWVATAATGTYLSGVTLDSKASYSRAWNGSGSTNTLTSIGTSTGAYSANIGTSKSIAASSGTTGSHTHSITIASSGGGAAHNNMPPYATYYCWERTA